MVFIEIIFYNRSDSSVRYLFLLFCTTHYFALLCCVRKVFHSYRCSSNIPLMYINMDVCLQLELLSAASQHGDMESVRFLLKDARVQFPQEPNERNPAILAAHYGHHSVVQELLDSIPCK